MKRWIGALATCGIFFLADVASAQDNETVARAHFQLGSAQYDAGNFDGAAREFEEAYRISQRPALFYNIYLAHRDAGHVAEAARALRSYLELVPEPENEAQLRARLAAMDRALAEAQATTAIPAPPQNEDTTTTTPAANVAPVATTVDAPVELAAEEPAASGGIYVPGLAIGGVGVAMLIGGAVTGAMALSAQSDLDAACTADHVCAPGFEETRDRGQTLATVTDILLIGGAVVAATGVIMAFTMGGEDAPVQSSLVCGTTGCLGSVRGHF